MSIRRYHASIDRFFHHVRLTVTRIEPSSGALRYRPLPLTSLAWPKNVVHAATTQQEHHRTPPMGCIRQIWSMAHVMRHASVIGTSLPPGARPPLKASDRNTEMSRTTATAWATAILHHHRETHWDCAMAREATLRAVFAIEERILAKLQLAERSAGEGRERQPSVGRDGTNGTKRPRLSSAQINQVQGKAA